MGDKDSDNYPRYRIMLQIEDVLTGQTYGPEPVELYKTEDADDVIEQFEHILKNTNLFRPDWTP